MTGYIGKSVLRGEDERLLKGKGTFTDDIQPAHALFAAFVRSPHAHARINTIDVTQAADAPGVRLILTAAEWGAAGLGRFALYRTGGFQRWRAVARSTETGVRPRQGLSRGRHRRRGHC